MSGLSVLERQVLDVLVAGEKAAVSADEVAAIREVSRPAANVILSRLEKKGWLRRVKRGVYMLVPLGSSTPEPAVEDAWPLAMELFAPCYISGWSAAEHWDLTEQIFNTIVVVTAHPQRRATQTLAGVRFRTRTVAAQRIFGTQRIWFGSRQVDVADPHRLVIDILDAPELGGGGRHTLDIVRVYWKSKHANAERLLDYAVRFARGTVFKRLGFTAEKFAAPPAHWLDKCRQHLSAGVSDLDPAAPSKGRIVSRWRLRVNVPLDES